MHSEREPAYCTRYRMQLTITDKSVLILDIDRRYRTRLIILMEIKVLFSTTITQALTRKAFGNGKLLVSR